MCANSEGSVISTIISFNTFSVMIELRTAMHYLTENIDSKPIVKLAVSSGGAFHCQQ